jgi:3-oxoacid CoA-transferase B subunit
VSSTAEQIARRAAAQLHDGEVVNLGVGIPTLVADHLPASVGLVLQTENGMLGVGPSPPADGAHPDLVNASKLPVSELPGASYFSSAESFAMIRGGHIDAVVLGGLQVDERGRVANWSVPGQPILGVGGAMDLLCGARRVIIAMTHLTRGGAPKIVEQATLPLSAERPASVVVTEHATFVTRDDQLVLEEIAPDSSIDWVREHTDANFVLGEHALAGYSSVESSS